MGKINKEFQWRMQGILHAREVVAKDGLEGLDSKAFRAADNIAIDCAVVFVAFLEFI